MGSKPVAISASRGASILGLNDFQTAFEVWQLIMEEMQPGFNQSKGYDLPDPVDNASVRWGSAFESAGIKLSEQKQDNKIINRELLCAFNTQNNKRLYFNETPDIYEGLPFNAWLVRNGYLLTCHIDGMYDINEISGEYKPLHEFKTTSYWNWKDNYGETGSNKVPTYIQVQVQHQMLCTGADKCIVSVLVWPKRPEEWENEGTFAVSSSEKNMDGYNFAHINFSIPEKEKTYRQNFDGVYEWASVLNQMGYFHQYTIHTDKDLHKMLIEKYTTFWNENVLKQIPPEPTSYDDIKRMLSAPCGTVLVDDETLAWIEEYRQINQELGTSGFLSKRKEQLKVMILNKHKDDIKKVDNDEQEKLLFKDMFTNKQLLCYNKGRLTVSKLKEC